MVHTLNWLCVIVVLLAVSVESLAQNNAAAGEKINKAPPSNEQEIVAEEVVVESALNVRNPSQPVRRVREVLYYLIPDDFALLTREKRQGFGPGQGFGPFTNPNYGSSQSTAQANSHSNYFGLDGFQAANALAGAQVFQTQGPSGGFGASSNNAHTSTLGSSLLGGQSGSVSNAGGQTYNLPGGQSVNIAYNNGFSNTNGNPATSQGQSIAINQG